MKIESFLHKGLKALYAEGRTKGLPPGSLDKLRKIFAYLDAIETPDELRRLVLWKAHVLTGDRKGTWSLSVTGNWRLTFRVQRQSPKVPYEVHAIDLEDYH